MCAKPNVLLIVIDCLRSDRVFDRDRTCQTPNIDALATRSIGLPNMFVENSLTAPAFASIFTGCYSLTHGVTGLLGVRLNPELLTMADLFAANGYHTYAEVTGPLMPLIGLNQGFDEYNYRDQRRYHSTPWGADLLERFRARRFTEPWLTVVHFWEVHEPRHVPAEFDSPEWGATSYDRALSGLDPFIGRLLEACGPETVVLLTGDHGERVTETTPPDTLLPYFLKKLRIESLKDSDRTMIGEDVDIMYLRGQELNDVSQELVRHADAPRAKIGLGRRIRLLLKLLNIGAVRLQVQRRHPGGQGVWATLRRRWEDFLFGWAVARGDSRGAQLQLLRTTLSQFHLQHGYHIYDYLARVPFLVAGLPGFAAPRREEAAVKNIDILPTLGEALGLDLPSVSFHGESFVPVLRDGRGSERPTYMETRGGAQAVHAFYIRGIRTADYKLAYAPYDSKAPSELYDLLHDPAELHNIIAGREHIAQHLREDAECLAEAMRAANPATALSVEEQSAMIERLKSLGYM